MTRKATISGGFSRSIETIDGIAGVLGELALYGVPLTDLGEYLPEIEAVDPAMVQQFAAATFDDLFVVLVGDAQVFGAAIAAAHPNTAVIPLAQLDLGQPTAVKAPSSGPSTTRLTGALLGVTRALGQEDRFAAGFAGF